jgi:DNA repair protein RadC
MEVAEINLSYTAKVKAKDRPKITGSHSAHEILRESWNPKKIEMQEEFKALLLNRRNQVLGLVELSAGGIAGTVVDLKILFGAACKGLASALIIAHNHPSGELRPSDADRKLTKAIADAGKLLDIILLDHIILAPDGDFYSFADNGEI